MPGKVVPREEWLEARKDLLVKEKAALRAKESLVAQLRNDFPMVLLDKEYTFEGPDGKVQFKDLFDGRKQLVVYHFMLGPDSEKGCIGCSFVADNLPSHLEHLKYRETTLIMVSRAPYPKIAAFKKRMGWTLPWYSSYESDFNYDFQATLDEAIAPPIFNFKLTDPPSKGERPGLSIFLKEKDEDKDVVYHTYSTYSRGLEGLMGTYQLLDMTPLGRQEGTAAMAWKLHDEY